MCRCLWFLLQCASHSLARLIAGLMPLARDVCETVYASYPDAAEDGFRQALDRDEEG